MMPEHSARRQLLGVCVVITVVFFGYIVVHECPEVTCLLTDLEFKWNYKIILTAIITSIILGYLTTTGNLYLNVIWMCMTFRKHVCVDPHTHRDLTLRYAVLCSLYTIILTFITNMMLMIQVIVIRTFFVMLIHLLCTWTINYLFTPSVPLEVQSTDRHTTD